MHDDIVGGIVSGITSDPQAERLWGGEPSEPERYILPPS